MKTLSAEQRLKAYDDAIARAKKVLNCRATDREPGTSICEYIFPELAEYEEERIIRSLKEIVTAAFSIERKEVLISINGLKKEDLIAWLEKQGEYDKIVEKAKSEKQRVLLTETNGNASIDWDTCSLEDARRLLERGLQYINTKLEKQGEQKADNANKVEQKDYSSIDPHFGKPIEQKPAWSEEDEEMLKSIIATCEFARQDRDSSPARNLFEMQDNWLKSLKDRVQPQPKQEWKPSDEQMDALDSTLQYSNISYETSEYLDSLFNDLKKLK